MKRIKIEPGLSNLVERYNYIYLQKTNNQAFLLSQHIHDSDASFLEDELFTNREELLIEAAVDAVIYQTEAVVYILGYLPKSFNFRYDYTALDYDDSCGGCCNE